MRRRLFVCSVRNAEREIYMVTGKIDYLHQVIAFLLGSRADRVLIRTEATNQLELEASMADPS